MARIERNDDASARAAEEAARRAAEEAQRRAAEEARRRAEEAARAAAEAAKRAAEAAARQNSKMEAERKVGRQVRTSVRFEPTGKKPPVRQERQSVGFVVAKKAAEVKKMDAVALPRLENVAMKAADLVDRVQSSAAAVAQVAVKKQLAGAIGAAADVHALASAAVGELEGRVRGGAEGIGEMMPRIGEQLAHAAQSAHAGLALGEVAAVRKQLFEVKETVGVLHEANDRMGELAGGAWQVEKVRNGLDSILHSADRTDRALTLAEGKERFVEGEAVHAVNAARQRLGYEAVDAHASPEQWMPAAGEQPDPAAAMRKSDDPAAEAARLSAKLDALKERRAAGENVDAEWGSVKANLRNAESLLEQGATRMTGRAPTVTEDAVDGAAGPDGMDGPALPEGATMGPDGVPMDKDGMPLALSEADVQKIGTGFGPDGPKQVLWDEKSMIYPRAREQGLMPPELEGKLNDFANQSLPGSEKKPFEPGDIALMAKQLGIPLEKVDPNQLGQAARFISEGSDPQNQRTRISMAMQNLTLISNDKLPTLQKSDVAWMSEQVAKIPYKAFNDVKGDVNAEFQKVAGALNTPGESQFKIGKTNVTTKVSDDGKLESTQAKKPGFLSKLGGVLKTVAKIGAIIPGPWQPICMVVTAAINVYSAIKNKNWLGVVAGVAGVIGPVGGVIGRVANGVKAVANGIQSIKRGGVGGILGGIAGIAGGVVGSFGNGLGNVGASISTWAERVGKVGQAAGAVEGVMAANKALNTAKAALAQARASGDPQAIAQALKGVEEAERGKRSSILGAGATALTLAAGSLPKNKDAAGNTQAPGQRNGLQFGLQLGADAFSMARNVNDRNYLGALADGFSAAADLKQGTQVPEMNQDAQGNWHDGAMRKAADAAQGLASWQSAEKGEKAASQGVDDARAALNSARRSGDPARVAQAEAGLKRAERAKSDAQIATGNAVIDAGVAMRDAVGSYRAQQQFDAAIAKGFEESMEAVDQSAGDLQTLRSERSLDAQQETDVLQSQAALAGTQQQLADALRSGDKAAIARAKMNLDAAQQFADHTVQDVSANAPELMVLPVSNRNFGDLLSAVPGLPATQSAPEISFDGPPQPGEPLLDRGALGHEVWDVQRRLNSALGTNLTADGNYGDKTAAAVLEFQHRNHLPETGAIDQATQEALMGVRPQNRDLRDPWIRFGDENGQVTIDANGNELWYAQVDDAKPIPGTRLYTNGVSLSDPQQGFLGDCFFIAGMSSVAGANPRAIQNAINDNGDGTYTVRLFERDQNGKLQPAFVRVDGDLPAYQANGQPAYGRSSDPSELWPAILEKALASRGRGYDSADQGGDPGYAISMLTGRPTVYTPIDTSTPDQVFTALSDGTSSRRPVVATTIDDKAKLPKNLDPNVHTNHAYTVLGTSTVNGARMVTLRNPWGDEWNNGQVTRSAVFTMPFADFLKAYGGVSVGK